MGVIDTGRLSSSTHQIAQCLPLCGFAATLSPSDKQDYDEEEKRLSSLFIRLVTADLIGGGAMFAPLP